MNKGGYVTPGVTNIEQQGGSWILFYNYRVNTVLLES